MIPEVHRLGLLANCAKVTGMGMDISEGLDWGSWEGLLLVLVR